MPDELPEKIRPQTGDVGKPAIERGNAGRFAKGASGNPRGRPRGSRNERAELLDALLSEKGEAIVEKLVGLAADGVPFALRLAVERLLPIRMDRRVVVDLPKVDSAESVSAAVAQVISLASAGELTVNEASAFLKLIEQQRQAVETHQLAGRLELLESREKKGLQYVEEE